MDQQQIFAVAKRVISERLMISPSQIRWGSSLRKELKATVADLVEIEMTIEEELGIPSIESRILTAKTVRDIVNAFYRRPFNRFERFVRAVFGTE